MKDAEARAINIEEENNIEQLRKLTKYWQEKAAIAEYQLKIIRGLIPEEDLKKSFNIDRIKEIMNSKK